MSVDEALHAVIVEHLRASGEPVREAFLYERIGGASASTPEHFMDGLIALEVEGRVHVHPVHDEVEDPAPFQPRFWRIAA